MILFNAFAFNSFVKEMSEKTTPDNRFFKLAITEHDRFIEREELAGKPLEEYDLYDKAVMLITPDSAKGSWAQGGGRPPIEVLASYVNKRQEAWRNGEYGILLISPQEGAVQVVLAKPKQK